MFSFVGSQNHGKEMPCLALLLHVAAESLSPPFEGLHLESSGHQKDDQERMRSVKQRPVWQMVWLNDWEKMEDVQLFRSVLSILSR